MSKVLGFPQQSIDSKVQEYDRLRDEAKTIKSRMDVLAKEIKAFATENGVKNDTGSYYCENENYMFGSQAKKSVNFDEEKAMNFLKEKGFNDAIKTKEYIDENAVERHIENGDITYEELESITTTKVTYAIDLKRKEAMPVVEESTVAMAASRKPARKPLKKG